MSFLRYFLVIFSLVFSFAFAGQDSLTEKENALTYITALATDSNAKGLKQEFNRVFDQKALTVNEAQAALEQLHIYIGLPRAWNAMTVLMETVNERNVKGLPTEIGRATTLLPPQTNHLENGLELWTTLRGGNPPKGGVFDFSPTLGRYIAQEVFGEIYSDDRLTLTQRQLVNIAAMSVDRCTDLHCKLTVNGASAQVLANQKYNQLFYKLESLFLQVKSKNAIASSHLGILFYIKRRQKQP